MDQDTFNDENQFHIDSGVFSSPKRTTTIERYLSPIRRPNESNESPRESGQWTPNQDYSFTKTKGRKSGASFTPKWKSTPVRKSDRRKKRLSSSGGRTSLPATSLWDKAINKNPQLGQWIDDFNKKMEQVDSFELSVANSSFTDV